VEDSQQKATILAVDDSRVMLVAAAKALKGEFEVLRASDGQEAWDTIQQHPEISVVFSDLSMPNMDGYELLKTVRASDNPQIAKLPVVILTGQEDGDGTKEKVMHAGATDFLTKPFESLDLLSRARSLSSLSTQVNELEKKVSLDKLTRLYTEISFNDGGERALSYALRHGTPITVMRFDIDDFSQLFVKHGKEIAEAVLTQVSECVKSVLRQEDIAARLGVAKFALLLIETDEHGAIRVVERLREAINSIDFEINEKIEITLGSDSPVVDETTTFQSIKDKAEEALLEAGHNVTKTAFVDSAADVLEKAKEADRKPATTAEAAKPAKAAKRGPRIDLSAVMREVDKNDGQRLGEPQLNAALNSVIPLLSFLNKKMALGIDDVIEKLKERVKK